jgi:hypothetical protein
MPSLRPRWALSFRQGCLVGMLIAVASVFALDTWFLLNRASGTPDQSFSQLLFLVLAIAIPLFAYVGGIALAMRRSKRRGAVGILAGLTVGYPVVFVFTVLILWESP